MKLHFLKHGYSVIISFMIDYYFVYIEEFGWSTCSNTGSTIGEALLNLDETYLAIVNYYIKKNKKIPQPFKHLYDDKEEYPNDFI